MMGDMKKIALLIVAMLCGCTSPDSDPRWYRTEMGTRVLVPAWLWKKTPAEFLERALVEIDTTKPDPDPRISPDVVGCPANLAVVIRDPGMYEFLYSPTGLARGHTDMYSYIYCAWRMLPWETERLLPALGHEYRHAYTKDAEAGH
jgi:hypothetical protein